MTRFTLHVPEANNSGDPFGPETFAAIEERLLDIAGGFTLTHGIGVWRDPEDGTTYRDPLRLYSVDAEDTNEVLLSFGALADTVALALRQECVYLTRGYIAPSFHYADGRTAPALPA